MRYLCLIQWRLLKYKIRLVVGKSFFILTPPLRETNIL